MDATHGRMKRRNLGPWRFFAHAIAMIVLLAGCAYVGVPATSDPYANYAYACALADARRVMPAEDMFRQAIDGFRERGHLGAQAMAMIDYAHLITSPAFIAYRLPPGYAPLVKGPLWPSHRLVALGGSEGIDATAHAINLDAAGIAAKALVRSSPDDRLASPTQLHLIIAKAHALAGNRVEACAALQDASRAYAQERRSDLTPIDRRSKNITENPAGERERLGCG